jgi:endonuclease/exonuclease/phosphatase family metal-dependent hydrolase
VELRDADAAGILYSSASDVPRRRDASSVRVCSWNINEGKAAHNQKLAGSAADAALALAVDADIDILVLQEVPMEPSGKSVLDGIFSSNSDLRYSCATALSPGYMVSEHSGICVLSRWPLYGCRTVILSNPNLRWQDGDEQSMDKGVVACEIRLEPSELRIVALHSFPFHRFRRSPAEASFSVVWDEIAAVIDAVASGGRAIVLGDFNASDRSLLTRRLRTQVSSAMTGIVTHADLAADDILLTEDLVLDGGPFGIWDFSDHLVCIADVACGPGS